jgi:hypothetical protein
MFQNHARKIVFALSLIAAAGAMIPAAQPAAAAPVSGDTSATAVRLDVEQVKPGPAHAFNKVSILPIAFDTSGNTTHYGFKIQVDLGTLKDAKATLIAVYRTLGTQNYVGPSPAVEYDLGDLSAPNYRLVNITCVPQGYLYCDSAEVRLTTSNGVSARYVNDRDGNKVYP